MFMQRMLSSHNGPSVNGDDILYIIYEKFQNIERFCKLMHGIKVSPAMFQMLESIIILKCKTSVIEES